MFFIGIDVSKAKLDCSLLLDVASSKRRTKTVANSKAGIADLLAWCTKQHAANHELHAILEGTGVYHEQAALALTDAGVTVSIVNPAQVKDFGRSLGIRTKTDGVDSLILARYGALLSPKPWHPPSQGTCSASPASTPRSYCPGFTTRTQSPGKSRCDRHASIDSSIPLGLHRLSKRTASQTSTRH